MIYNKSISNLLLSIHNFIVDSKTFLFLSWLQVSFPYNKIWSELLVLLLIMRSSTSLMSLWRGVLSTRNKWQCSKKWDVVSGFNLYLHRGLRISQTLCLNLCSFKWLKPNWSLANSFILMGLWISNVSTCFGRMKFNTAFLKAVYDVMFHQLWHLERKNFFNCPAVKRWKVYVISINIKMINWWH